MRHPKILVPIGWVVCLLVALSTVSTASAQAPAAETWTEGIQYFRVVPAQSTNPPAGKVEVTEVFSYGCPYCARFVPTMHALVASLPANVQVDYLPAGFSSAEDFPMFQRAYFTAQMLGVAAQTHDAMFDAVWGSGELSIYDPTTNRLKNPLPSIADAAQFYQRHAGVPVPKFLAAARSAAIEEKIANGDALVRAYRVPGTPCIIVDGQYRVNMEAMHSTDELIQLVNWLVKQRSR
jgi:protein dithiol oxidoreductase (disulfide-forming)